MPDSILADNASHVNRKPLSVRTRFEVFKRDGFTCRYCGRMSPDVILEIDHVIPICEGGSDDPMNLVTSCWECNRGKSAVPLADVMTGEDPHDKGILLLERERQLEEYNAVLEGIRERREETVWKLHDYWGLCGLKCDRAKNYHEMPKSDFGWFMKVLEWCPVAQIQSFMDQAHVRGADLRYVKVCVRNWREDRLGVS
jgi:hypothetical protein